MSYEVELLKAWMVQGQRTENDGTPIPPVMPEPTPTGEPRTPLNPYGLSDGRADIWHSGMMRAWAAWLDHGKAKR